MYTASGTKGTGSWASAGRLRATSFILVAAQVLVLAALGSRTTAARFSEMIQLALGLICILACVQAFRRSLGVARYIWRLMAVTFAVWSIAQGLGVYVDFAGTPALDRLDNILFFVSVIPFGMLPFLDPDSEPNSFDRLHILDFIQVCVFWFSILLCFSPRAWSPETAYTIGPFTWSQNIAFDGLLVATFVLRGWFGVSRSIRRFFLRMAIFLMLSGLADSYALNPKQNLAPGGWFDLTWSVLLAMPVLIAAGWNQANDTPAERAGRGHLSTIQALFPLVYPLFSFLVLAHISRIYPMLSPALFALAFMAFAGRTLILQKRQQQSEAELRIDVAERLRVEEALRHSEVEYRLLFESNPISMWVFDRSSLRFLAVNTAAVHQYGFSREEFLAMTIADIRPAEDLPNLLQATARPLQGLQAPQTWRHKKKDGSIFNVEIVAHELHFRGIEAELIAAYDITRREASEQALRRAEEKYRAIFEDAVIGIFQATPEGRPVSINRAMASLHGYDSPEQLMAEVRNVVTELFVHPSRMEELLLSLEENGVVHNVELELYRRDRSKKWALANLRAIRDDAGKICLLEGTIEDITDRKRAEERVEFFAYYDALTGLPNRTLLQDRLGKALPAARRRKEKVALLFLDLDRFKIINDSLGHSFGDMLLQEVAERLKKWAREQDTVARIGGDEFVLVLSGIKDMPDAAVAAERIMDAITADFIIQDRRLNISCSIGISMYPQHGSDSETLVKNADAAMYCAKEAGRNVFRFFTDEMNVEVVERLTIEHNLRKALERKELFLAYQPQMEITSGQIVGVEALIRWQHPELGLVPPNRFIPVAENSGLILPIGEWVLETACSAAKKWQEQGLPPVPVAVNVSAIQFRQDGFRDFIGQVLRRTGLAPQYLELEVTESLLLSNADLTVPVLQELKAMGVKLAIDDFGTGYSSLSYLRHFPINKLKIDRSFIKLVDVNLEDATLTAAIINMGRSLNLKVIAEGVETEAQMEFLRKNHCDEIQGYYYSKPLTLAEFADRLRSAGVPAYDDGLKRIVDTIELRSSVRLKHESSFR